MQDEISKIDKLKHVSQFKLKADNMFESGLLQLENIFENKDYAKNYTKVA